MRRPLIALILCLACDRPASDARQVVASSTPPALTPAATYALEDTTYPPYAIISVDSAYGAWSVDGPAMGPSEFYIGSSVQHPSGSMVIWFDTAVRATENHPVGHAHTDSVVVNGVEHLRYLGQFCFVGAAMFSDPAIVGLVPEGDSVSRPQLAWRFNKQSLRIEKIPVDSLKCRMTDPLEGEVD